MASSEKEKITYAKSGVNIASANAMLEQIKPFIKATKRLGSDPEIGGFGAFFDPKKLNYKDPLLVAATDGVGTKLKIAIETNQHNTIGIDLVAMCVNDLIVQGAEPLFFLDYFATGTLKPEQATEIISGISKGCQIAGCALIGGETAEMPGMYQENDYDLAGFCVGMVERTNVLPKNNLKEGDLVLGLSSSGLHSNGYSLIRKIIQQEQLNWNDLAPFDNKVTLAEALLTPTRIYVPALLNLLQYSSAVKALAHITGGGFGENIPRILPKDLGVHINLSAIIKNPIFPWIAQVAQLQEKELLDILNCGVGMILIIDPQYVDEVCTILTENGENVMLLGHVKKNDTAEIISYEGCLLHV